MVKYIFLENEEIKSGDHVIAFGVIDVVTKVDNHIPAKPNYYGKKIKWTTGSDCKKIKLI